MTGRLALLLAMLAGPLLIGRTLLAVEAVIRRSQRARRGADARHEIDGIRRRRANLGRMLRELPSFVVTTPLALVAGTIALGSGISAMCLLSWVGLSSISGCAAWLGLRAGRLEAGGAWRPARRLARRAGTGMAVGLLPLAALALLTIAHAPAEPNFGQSSARPETLALLAFSFATAVSLLGGLAAKPRPSQTLGAAAHLVGLVALVAG